MSSDATVAHPPMWVRVIRTTIYFGIAAVIAWRGAEYDSPDFSAAMPFLLSQLTAVALGLLGLVNLCGPDEPGPA